MKSIKIIHTVCVVVVLSFFIQSCEVSDKKRSAFDSSGGTLELLVVTDNSEQWKGPVGDSIRAFFGQIRSTMPQAESRFTMANLGEKGLSKMFKPHHNIFIVTFDRSRDNALIETKKDFWAKPQRVIKMSVPSEESFFLEFNKYKESFMQMFMEVELERSNKIHLTALERSISNKLVEDYQLSLVVPAGFTIAVKQKDFVWIRREAQSFSQGIIIYFEDYIDTNQFNPEYILKLRNTMVEKYIPGPSDGSYMSTAVSVIEPAHERIKFNGQFAVETRGLWETKGDFMGGPFVSYTTVDEARNRVVTIEGYVYYPNKKKTILLHQVDAICHSIKFDDK
ncbi:MAG: DUF4837 family protein [Bacteroidales bacterium]|nr:DUF4837 family protein [Bacteroidales bacterium]